MDEEQDLQVETTEEPQTEKPDYIRGLNRVLTALIAGIIGSGILFLVLYFGAQLVSENLNEDGFSIGFLLIALLSIFFTLFVTGVIQMYFFKLVEKEKYSGLGKKVFSMLMVQLVLLLLAFPFVFVTLSFGTTALSLLLMTYFMFSLIANTTIRESGLSGRLVGNMVGLFTASMLFIVIFLSLGETVQILFSVLLLPMALLIEALFDLFADIGIYLANK